MKIIATIASFGDSSTSGAAIMNMWLLRALKARGHEVEIWVPTRIVNPDCDDIPVLHYIDGIRDRKFYGADVIFTSPDVAGRIGAKVMRHTGLPGIAVIHNMSENNQRYFARNNWELVVWGSHATKNMFCGDEEISSFNNDLVVHPPLNVKANRPGRSSPKFNTAVNLSYAKGGQTFWDVAEQMPKHQFLGIRSWGQQLDGLLDLENVTIENSIPHADIKQLWKRTRILLVPSIQESWGMAASEAMAAGRPVIAHPNDGLKENLSYAGIWAHRNYPQEYVSLIEMLDDPVIYKEWSARSYQRALEIEKQSKKDLQEFVLAVEQIQ